MSAQLTVVIQNLTSELDACKKKLRTLEKENEQLRQRLTATLTAKASAAAAFAAAATAAHRNPQPHDEGAVGNNNNGSEENDSDSMSQPQSSTVFATYRESSLSLAEEMAPPFGLEAGSEHRLETQSQGKESSPKSGLRHSVSGDLNNATMSSSSQGLTGLGTSTSALVANLRRKVELLERREASHREQIACLQRQNDLLRTSKDQEVQSLQLAIQELLVKLRTTETNLLKEQQKKGSDTSSFCTRCDADEEAECHEMAQPEAGAPPSECSSPTLVKRCRSKTVIKKRGDQLVAEIPEDQAEDIFSSQHVRTKSNNLVPISAVLAGEASPAERLDLTSPDRSRVSVVPANPNQLGEIVSDEVKDKRWYETQVIKKALRRAIGSNRGFLPPPGCTESDIVLPTLQGRDVKSINLMAKENYTLYFHLKDNQVVMTESEVTNLPPFHTQNSDPNLLSAFSSSASGVHAKEGATAAAAAAAASSSGHQQSGGNNIFSSLNARSEQIRIIFPGLTLLSYIRAYLRFDFDSFVATVEEAPWRDSTSPGKSDASMYFFGNFVIKSVKEEEYRFLKDAFLSMYAKHVEQNPQTLLTKFYSLFSVYSCKRGTRKHYFLMNNVFWTKHYINRIYDIKGSTCGRDADAKEGARTAFGALLLKDNDLPPQLIICGPLKRATLLAQLRSDTSFLASLSVLDYSCIIGVRTRIFTRDRRNREAIQQATIGGPRNHDPDTLMNFTSADGGILSLPIYAENDPTTVREDTYYLGLIDVLQVYSASKKFEHFAKGILHDKSSISVIPPKDFAERLCRLIERITV